MNRTPYRFLSVLAAGAAALTLGAAPALAGSDGCDDEDECQPPAQVVPAPPAPVTLQLPAAPAVTGGDRQPETSKKQAVNVVHRTVAQRTVPHGAVAAGAGGAAPHGPGSALLGLAGAGLILVGAGGRLVTVSRRAGA